jgi:soluble lytic murein transglycosylase-like protein
MAAALLGAAVFGSVFALPAAVAAKTAVESPAESFSLTPLSPADGKAYASAFAAVRAGDFEAAEALSTKVADPLLLGRLGYAKLMHPGYRASYAELAGWLERYPDHPDADRVYALARKRKPAAAPALAVPAAMSDADAAIWARVENLAERFEAKPARAAAAKTKAAKAAPAPKAKADDGQQAAREAYYKGDVDKALGLAVESGETWIAGLAAFRLKRYDEARERFAELAEDESRDEWVRSGAAYWASRAAIAGGSPEAAPQYLSLAARTPYTFYGLIAERQLGLDPGVTAAGIDPAVTAAPRPARAPTVAGSAGAAVAKLVETDKRARRAAALTQIGLKAEAGAELRTGLAAAGTARQTWMRLGLALNAPLTSQSDRAPRQRFDIAQFPTPELTPDGGFTLDKALVYALVRQESRFNPAAASAAGAYGLMQLMPATAARVAGDDKLKTDPSRLKEPGFNLRLGQDYVARLLTALDGDLLHAVAAYNSGPGVIQKTLAQLGKNADSLLAIESMPGGQTREFVEKVVANYWIYRNIFGTDSPTLDAAASGRRAVSAALDQTTNLTTAQLRGETLAALIPAVN